jgi:hypothetical protein
LIKITLVRRAKKQKPLWRKAAKKFKEYDLYGKSITLTYKGDE